MVLRVYILLGKFTCASDKCPLLGSCLMHQIQYVECVGLYFLATYTPCGA
jgi:hypothetical protein